MFIIVNALFLKISGRLYRTLVSIHTHHVLISKNILTKCTYSYHNSNT